MPQQKQKDLIRDISIRHSIFICFTVSALVASVLVGVSLYERLSSQLTRTIQQESQVLMGHQECGPVRRHGQREDDPSL